MEKGHVVGFLKGVLISFQLHLISVCHEKHWLDVSAKG